MSETPDPTTLIGTLVSLELAKEDKKAKDKQDAKDRDADAQEKQKQVGDSGYTNFTNWGSIERPRVGSLAPVGNAYLSKLAISGEDYLRFQAKLNPNAPFIKPS